MKNMLFPDTVLLANSPVCSVTAAFGSVFLKHILDGIAIGSALGAFAVPGNLHGRIPCFNCCGFCG